MRLKRFSEFLNESKQTEQQGLSILNKNNITDTSILDKFKESDTTKNQIIIPFLCKLYVEINDVTNVVNLGKDISELFNNNKIKTPTITPNGYKIGDKVFNDFLSLSEYIHGLSSVTVGDKGDVVIKNTDTIFDNGFIKIYDGNDVGKCIYYTQGGLTGRRYSFCIGQPGNTMWKSYRDTKTSTFYFVIDTTKDMSDPLHIVVVDSTKHGIELTDADNKTGNISEYGSSVNRYINYLKGMGVPTDKLFINKPKTQKEIDEDIKLGRIIYNLDFFKELTFEEKQNYIGRGHELTDKQYNYLYSFIDDKNYYKLISTFLDMGHVISYDQLGRLFIDKKMQLIKTYFRKREIVINSNNRMFQDYEKSFLIDNNLTNLLLKPYRLYYLTISEFNDGYAVVQNGKGSSFIDENGELVDNGKTWYHLISKNKTITGNIFYICSILEDLENDKIILDSKLNILCNGDKFNRVSEDMYGVIEVTKEISRTASRSALINSKTFKLISDKNGPIYVDQIYSIIDKLIEVVDKKTPELKYIDRKGNKYDEDKNLI